MVEFLRPDADGTIGNWTGEDGRTTNLYTSINESTLNLTNYIQSGTNPSNDKVRFRYSDPAGLITSGKVRYTYGKKNNNSTVVNQRTQLVQGASTIIAFWDHADIPYTPTTVVQDLTGPQLTSITDFTDIWIEHIANPASGAWEPSALGALLGLAYDPWAAGDLFQLSDGTSPVTTTGDPIGCLKELYDAGPPLIMPTTTRRPLWDPSLGMVFDGVDDYLRTYDNGSFTFGTTDKLGMACKVGADATAALGSRAISIWAEGVGGDHDTSVVWSNILGGGSSTGFQGLRYGSALGNVLAADTTRQRIFSELDGANHKIYLNDGTASTPVAATGNIGTTLHLSYGAGVSAGSLGANPHKGPLGRAVVTKAGTLSAGQRTSLDAWLNAH